MQCRNEQKFHKGQIPKMPPQGIFRGPRAWLPKKVSEHIRKNEDKKIAIWLLQLTFDCYTTYTAYVLNTRRS